MAETSSVSSMSPGNQVDYALQSAPVKVLCIQRVTIATHLVVCLLYLRNLVGEYFDEPDGLETHSKPDHEEGKAIPPFYLTCV